MDKPDSGQVDVRGGPTLLAWCLAGAGSPWQLSNAGQNPEPRHSSSFQWEALATWAA